MRSPTVHDVLEVWGVVVCIDWVAYSHRDCLNSPADVWSI